MFSDHFHHHILDGYFGPGTSSKVVEEQLGEEGLLWVNYCGKRNLFFFIQTADSPKLDKAIPSACL